MTRLLGQGKSTLIEYSLILCQLGLVTVKKTGLFMRLPNVRSEKPTYYLIMRGKTKPRDFEIFNQVN